VAGANGALDFVIPSDICLSVMTRTREVSRNRQTRTGSGRTLISLSINQINEGYTMSKSPIRKVRRFAAAVVGVLASLAAVCAAAPAAFAMPLSPVDQSGTGSTVASHNGTPGWEIALIAVGAVMLICLFVAVVLHRHAPARLNRAVS
jgi:hypothetical protein